MSHNQVDAAASGATEPVQESSDASQFCPNCSAQLKQNHRKLTCPQCGFYLSCSDFY